VEVPVANIKRYTVLCQIKQILQLQETSMEDPLYDFLISSPLVKKYGRHGQFLFLIG
jgi:hypothetical protein